MAKASKVEEEYVIVGHLIKYNLYLVAKALVFHAIFSKSGRLADAVRKTNQTLEDLDLDVKLRKEQEKAKE